MQLKHVLEVAKKLKQPEMIKELIKRDESLIDELVEIALKADTSSTRKPRVKKLKAEKKAPVEVTDAHKDAVLEAVSGTVEPLSRAEIEAFAETKGVELNGAFKPAVDALVADGKLTGVGKGRGKKYAMPAALGRSSGETVDLV